MTKKDFDIDERFARFGLRPLSDADVWALGMATMVMPDGNPGAEAYLSQVSGTTLFAERLTIWGRVVALGIAQGSYKAPNGRRRRAYVEGYDESWGRYAVADGLTLALYGYAEHGIKERCAELGCGFQPYQRIRDFVGGAIVNAIAEFRIALEWALGHRHDRLLEARWAGVTGLNWCAVKSDAIVSGVGETKRMFAIGCKRTPPAKDYPDPHDIPHPETQYSGLRPSDWWDEAEARRMRNATVTMILYPGHGN